MGEVLFPTDFEVAYKWSSTYNAMPEEAGKKPTLIGSATEAQWNFWRMNNDILPSTVAGDRLADIKEAIYRGIWLRLFCPSYASGLSYFVFDLAHRHPPSVVSNWLMYLAGQAPGGWMTNATVELVNEKYTPLELIEELSVLSYRRLRTNKLWKERKQRWVNRNTQAAERAKKLWRDSQPS